MVYLAVVPLASFMIKSVFVQPQAMALGVPLAGIGMIVMAVQFTAMAGSAWSARITAHLGEGRILYAAPLVICSSLLLAALQIIPVLLLIGMMGFGPPWYAQFLSAACRMRCPTITERPCCRCSRSRSRWSRH